MDGENWVVFEMVKGKGAFAFNEAVMAALWFSPPPSLENTIELSISGMQHCNKTYENYLLLHQAL